MNKRIIFLIIIFVTGLTSCQKYLDVKPNSSITVPVNLVDLQSILDKQWGIGVNVSDESCDDYYLPNSTYNSIQQEYLKRRYTWQNSNIFPIANTNSDLNLNDWSAPYGMIYFANTILEDLDKIQIKQTEKQTADDVKGQALFWRGKMYLELVDGFCKAYDSTTASTDLGLPLRLTTDFNQRTPRSSVKDTYRQIIEDLTASITLLPVHTIHGLRPSKPAAYGMVARAYLAMREYEKSRLYADSCLQIKSTLIDYNTIADATQPFTIFKVPEVIFDWWHSAYLATFSTSFIDPALIQLYDANDLRKNIFFTHNPDDTYVMRTSYEGYFDIEFDGIATDEMYLIRAEGFARKGELDMAMQDLDLLLQNRYSNEVPYVKHVTTDQRQAINWILDERRKELLFRGLRWMDIKRLNLEGANITIRREVNGETYTLPPNSPRYATPIPDDVIHLSGLQQNTY